MITLINHQGLKTRTGIQIQTPAPSIGLAYIGAFLKKHGHSYTGIDACGEGLDQIYPHPKKANVMVQGLTIDQVLARVPADSQIVGFTCLFSHCWSLVHDMATAIRKKLPHAIFIVGGEHPTAMPEFVLSDGLFNGVVYGEGEETFLELIERIEAGKDWHDLHGVIYRDANNAVITNPPRKRVTNVDEFPYPDWDNWSLEAYIQNHQVTGINVGRSTPILGSRGCPYACSFCSNEGMWTRKYLMRGAKSIVDEMEFMHKKYNVTGFNFMDLTFIINRKEILEFCRELIARRLPVTYQLPAGTRCESFDDELVQGLELSGLRNFAFAPESGSELILKAIRKEIRLPRFFEAVRATLKSHMTVACFIVIGFPEETRETLKETLALVRKLAFMGIHDVTVSKFTPYPGSQYFKDLQKSGVLSKEYLELENVIDFFGKEGKSFCGAVSYKQLYHWMLWMFINFYVISFVVRPWRFIKYFWIYFTEGVETTRYMRFFTDFFFIRRKWKRSRSIPGAAMTTTSL